MVSKLQRPWRSLYLKATASIDASMRHLQMFIPPSNPSLLFPVISNERDRLTEKTYFTGRALTTHIGR